MQKMQVKLGGSPSRVIQVLHELVHKPLYCKIGHFIIWSKIDNIVCTNVRCVG